MLFAVIVFFAGLIASHRGLPNVLVIMTVLIGLYAFVTTRTVVGRQIYAIGGNARAASLSGIKTERLTFLTFVNMGVLAALAGLVFAARLNTATPKAGAGFELDVIAACFIGGASAYGGVGRVGGAVIGAMIMGVMNNGMSILGIGIDYQQVIKGLVLLGAVCLDVYNQRRIAGPSAGFSMSGLSFLQLPAADDAKPRVRVFLAAQRNRVDRQRSDARRRKPLAQHRHNRLAPFGGKPSRQRHVEAKFLEHVRVAPAVEIVALPRRQLVGISPRAVFRAERRTERIERLCRFGGEQFEFGRRLRPEPPR